MFATAPLFLRFFVFALAWMLGELAFQRLTGGDRSLDGSAAFVGGVLFGALSTCVHHLLVVVPRRDERGGTQRRPRDRSPLRRPLPKPVQTPPQEPGQD